MLNSGPKNILGHAREGRPGEGPKIEHTPDSLLKHDSIEAAYFFSSAPSKDTTPIGPKNLSGCPKKIWTFTCLLFQAYRGPVIVKI